MNYEELAMQLILHGGNARGLAYEALDHAENYEFAEADKLLQQANDEFLEGHKYQTQLIQIQDKQNEKDIPIFIIIHAQDHVMTAQAELQLIKRMVNELKKTAELEKRLEKLENK